MNSFDKERQLETTMEKRIQARRDSLTTLVKDRWGKVNYIGDLPRVCQACLDKDSTRRLLLIRHSAQCQLNCKFCYYRGQKRGGIPKGMATINGRNYQPSDIDILLDADPIDTVRWLYYEPLFEVGTMLSFMTRLKKRNIYQSLNTNGLKADKSMLSTLKAAGLSDIRFNLAATNCSKKVMDNAWLAKQMGFSVGVETPMYPEFKKVFLENKDAILERFSYFCFQELHITPASLPDFGKIYRYRGGQTYAISSSECTYDIMDIAEKEGWSNTVLDCGGSLKYYRNMLKRMPWESMFQELPRGGK